MVALTADRNITARLGEIRTGPLAAAVKVWAGCIVMRGRGGLFDQGRGCGGQCARPFSRLGRAEATVDNAAGAAGAVSLEYRRGSFKFANSAVGDLAGNLNGDRPMWTDPVSSSMIRP